MCMYKPSSLMEGLRSAAWIMTAGILKVDLSSKLRGLVLFSLIFLCSCNCILIVLLVFVMCMYVCPR